jgi:hypothetical protein
MRNSMFARMKAQLRGTVGATLMDRTGACKPALTGMGPRYLFSKILFSSALIEELVFFPALGVQS